LSEAACPDPSGKSRLGGVNRNTEVKKIIRTQMCDARLAGEAGLICDVSTTSYIKNIR